jgi:tetratricopeptide (TPR) repeat protein
VTLDVTLDVTRHIRLTGGCRADREQWLADNITPVFSVRCHQRLRGPYTGVDTILAAVLPEAAQRWPDLVEQHRFELLYGIPELAAVIGPAPATLASDSPFRERTRFFASDMLRCMSQGIVTFLLAHAERLLAAGERMPVLVFEDVQAAEPTTQEFLALLLRRCDPAVLRLVVSGEDTALPAELAEEIAAWTDRVAAPACGGLGGLGGLGRRTRAALAAAYVASHGTSDDPAEFGAYRVSPAGVRKRLHDEQAALLEPTAGPGLRTGAIAYHREHGSDPRGAGSLALAAAQRYCVEIGFSGAAIDLGIRGRAITDPVRDAKRYDDFTVQLADALIPLGRLDESMELYLELRRRNVTPKVHMATSYAIAMLYTRFFRPRDHEAAIQWQNNAAAIASILPDARERLVFGVFHDNALALIEMHRGNARRALELVEAGIARLDAEMGDREWALHRSQLLYNAARLKVALGDTGAAYADFSALIEMDPYYTDYLCERAKVSRQAGDLAAALADYDRAVRLAPPFPELYYNRGTARVALGDVDGALADFGYVLVMEPRDVDTRLSRADLLLRQGDLDGAMADAATGLAFSPDEPRLLCMLGTIHLERDELEAALDALGRAIVLDAEYPAALLNRAVAYYRSGQGQRSADDLTKVLAIVGNDPDVLLNRALAYRSIGRADLAVADLDRALELPGADLAELRGQRDACLPVLAPVLASAGSR